MEVIFESLYRQNILTISSKQSKYSYLYKTSKEFKSDIDNFGVYATKNYLTWDEWIESDWLYNYQNSFFTVNVNTEVKSGELYSKI